MADPAMTSIEAFRVGALRASEYLESLHAREEIQSKESSNETKTMKRRRKSQPESAQDDSDAVEATISSIETKTTKRKGPKTRGRRTAQVKSSLCQPDDVTAADKPAEHDVSESPERPLPVEVASNGSRAETESSQAIDAIPLAQCSNCPASIRRVRGNPNNTTLCKACSIYLEARDSGRLLRSATAIERPQAQRHCSNCHTTATSVWRRDHAYNTLCNACGLFLKAHGCARPVSLNSDLVHRVHPSEIPSASHASSGSSAPMSTADSDSPSTARDDGPSTGLKPKPSSGIPELSAEPPLPVEVPLKDRSHSRAINPILTQCYDCHTTATPSWRKDDAGRYLCNACGIYRKTHGRVRPSPLSIRLRTYAESGRGKVYRARVDVDSARKKKVQPVIMEVDVDPAAPKQCSKCDTTTTSLWCTDDAGNRLCIVCNACGEYLKAHGHRGKYGLLYPVAERTSGGAGAPVAPPDTETLRVAADGHPKKRRRVRRSPKYRVDSTNVESFPPDASLLGSTLSETASTPPEPTTSTSTDTDPPECAH
ncbi:hypothetical protein C8R44DRAFT_271 [Mycena epipterygia]|nr:hypothetical protein C8R44DRAFT_271 [Mycena epipterygia]